MNNHSAIKLSDFELEVMQLFWDKRLATAPEVHNIICKKRELSYSTVKTIIDRLEKKGALLRTRTEGRTIHYAPAVEALSIQKPLIKSFIDSVFHGNSKPLAAHILEEENLSLDDIEYLEALLKKRKKDI